jgi:two-component system, OmpR family, sensor kinase
VSLRTRLLLAAGIIVVVVVGGAALILRSQTQYLTNQIDERLIASRPFFGGPPPGAVGGVTPDGIDGPDQPVSDLYVGVYDGNELQVLLQGQLLGDIPALSVDDISGAIDAEPFTVGSQYGRTRFRVVVMHQTVGSPDASVIALPLDDVDKAIVRLRWGLAAGVVAITATLLLAVWWVERLGLRPVARVTEVADAIAAGDRTRRVGHVDEHTEAGRLATAFNVMLDERDASEERLHRFVSDASHELRTPLTSIRGYLELYSEGGFRGDGELDDAIRRMSHESARMQTLVEDLLLLAKLDEHPTIQHEPIDVTVLLEDLASDARVLQPERTVTVEATGPVIASGDRLRVEQLVGILVSNALVHTDREATVNLAARSDGSTVEVVVQDTGDGLSGDQATRVFDRFFRGDESRARTVGSSGLGLAIARSIVDAHGGGIQLVTAPGAGCVFTVRLPAAESGATPT